MSGGVDYALAYEPSDPKSPLYLERITAGEDYRDEPPC